MTTHCVSLEMAKKLKEAGWKKPTHYYWKSRWIKSEYGIDTFGSWHLSIGKDSSLDKNYPAPLATEILEELPYGYHVWKSVCMENDLGDWVCVHFSEPEFEYGEHWEQANNPCDALAKMWLYLREKKEV